MTSSLIKQAYLVAENTCTIISIVKTPYLCSNRIPKKVQPNMTSDPYIHRVPKKHVTTFSTITLTISVRLQ